MKPQGRLEIATGFASLCGRRADNQDYCGVYLGTAVERARMGSVAALADGVGGAKGGREAAELAIRSFIDGFYAQPETIGAANAARRSLSGFNRWLHATARSDPALEGAACTFTALILRGRRALAAHVGDSRAWHFRDGQLTQLTEDHVLPHPDQRHILYRAVGIEADLRLDFTKRDLAPHDRLLLTSDGVHGSLGAKAIAKLLAERNSPALDAEAIANAAAAAGSQDNITALVIDIISVPAVDADALAGIAEALPIGDPPAEGQTVDDFQLVKMLSDGRYTRVFHALDQATGQPAVLKFPKPALLSEEGARLAFTRESLVGARVDNPYVARALELGPDRQTRLYIAMPFYSGETLETRLTRSTLSIRNGVQVGARLARAAAALHRLDIIHRDIKPDNVILTDDGGLRLIDLGVARLPRIPEFARNEIPGTPSFMAPELFAGAPGDALSDQYAIGVTLYRLFTGRYPYGEVEPFSRPRFDRPVPPSKYRPDIPAWLDAAILKAVAVKPEDRFGDVVELQIALESGADRGTGGNVHQPLVERNPVLFWKLVSLVLGIALALSIALR